MQEWKLLIREPKVVKSIRASCVARYYWCAVQSYLIALGLKVPKAAAMVEGHEIHEQIERARNLTIAEQLFLDKIAPFFKIDPETKTKCIARKWAYTDVEGEFLTHGLDDFRIIPPNKFHLVEYKTKASYHVEPVDLAPAVFQAKLYCWILKPYMDRLGYVIEHAEVVFIKRRTPRRPHISAIGKMPLEINDATYREVEEDLTKILYQYNNPHSLIPPKKWKCLRCPKVFKKECVYQK